jgi:uncharacterized protein (DUF1684 family)
MENKTYRQTINNWREERDKNYRRENGWLSLDGLFWLKPGKNYFGSDPKCDIQLPERLPSSIGYFEYNEKSIMLHTNTGQKINVNDELVDFAILQTDISDNPSFITMDDVRLVVIQRGDRLGIRIWDNQREERRTFPALTWFDIDESFRIPATYTIYHLPKKVCFPDVMDEKSEFQVEGYFSFEFNGNHYQLDFNKEDDGTFFIRFWDPTSEDETYPTGRYLVVDEEDGKFFIDFNKAYSPPCSITNFATCVFAPEQNHLGFRVTAGETYSRH